MDHDSPPIVPEPVRPEKPLPASPEESCSLNSEDLDNSLVLHQKPSTMMAPGESAYLSDATLSLFSSLNSYIPDFSKIGKTVAHWMGIRESEVDRLKVEANRMFQPGEDLDMYGRTETAVELVRRGRGNKEVKEVVIVRRSQRIAATGLIEGPPTALMLTANETNVVS